jgi:hypothetical protein
VSSFAFLSDGKVYGSKQEQFVTPLRVESDGYSAAAARLKVDAYFLVNSLQVKRP